MNNNIKTSAQIYHIDYMRDGLTEKKWVSVEHLKAWLEVSMEGDSHTEFQKGYWKACKDMLELLVGETSSD